MLFKEGVLLMHTARCLLDMSGCVSIMVPSIGQGMIECNNFQNCNAETSKYPGPFLAKVTPVSDLRPIVHEFGD